MKHFSMGPRNPFQSFFGNNRGSTKPANPTPAIDNTFPTEPPPVNTKPPSGPPPFDKPAPPIDVGYPTELPPPDMPPGKPPVDVGIPDRQPPVLIDFGNQNGNRNELPPINIDFGKPNELPPNSVDFGKPNELPQPGQPPVDMGYPTDQPPMVAQPPATVDKRRRPGTRPKPGPGRRPGTRPRPGRRPGTKPKPGPGNRPGKKVSYGFLWRYICRKMTGKRSGPVL